MGREEVYRRKALFYPFLRIVFPSYSLMFFPPGQYYPSFIVQHNRAIIFSLKLVLRFCSRHLINYPSVCLLKRVSITLALWMLGYTGVGGSKIWSIIKRKLLGLKWVGNTTRQFTTPNESPRLFGDFLVSVYQFFTSNFNFSKSMKSSIFHISLNLPYPLRKKYLLPKMSKNHPNIYTKPQNCG